MIIYVNKLCFDILLNLRLQMYEIISSVPGIRNIWAITVIIGDCITTNVVNQIAREECNC